MEKKFTKGKWIAKHNQLQEQYEVYAPLRLFNVRYNDTHGLSQEEQKHNALIICDAVNGTAGIGINPNSVKEMKEALENACRVLKMASMIDQTNTCDKAVEICEQALKNSEL